MNELDELREKLIAAETRITSLEERIKRLQEFVDKMSKKKFPDLRWHRH